MIASVTLFTDVFLLNQADIVAKSMSAKQKQMFFFSFPKCHIREYPRGRSVWLGPFK